eukprot:jgi/Botrbrau1/389/Bobra.110_2s0044.1
MEEEATTTSSVPDWKSEGNKEFRNKNYLKAAALYTKGIKADPSNAVLYSNRSACLLKLLKIQKALSDADECIRLEPEWEKGYYRKGAILEERKDYVPALAAYKKAAELNPQNKEVLDKVRTLTKLTRKCATAKQVPLNGQHAHVNGLSNGSTKLADNGLELANGAGERSNTQAKAVTVTGTATSVSAYQKAKEEMVRGSVIELTEERALAFGEQLLQSVAAEVASGKTSIIPCVHFLQGQRGEDGSDQYGEVSIKEAFVTPETLQQCVEFLRQYGEDTHAHAACVIVAKQDISYPQVWKRKGFVKHIGNAIFVQLDSVKARRLWVIPEPRKDTPPRDPILLSSDYQLIPPILR